MGSVFSPKAAQVRARIARTGTDTSTPGAVSGDNERDGRFGERRCAEGGDKARLRGALASEGAPRVSLGQDDRPPDAEPEAGCPETGARAGPKRGRKPRARGSRARGFASRAQAH